MTAPCPAPPAAALVEGILDGLTAAQRRAVTAEGPTLCILAGAGAGKTRVLTRRIAHRVLTGSAEARHVLALTFTRKAATELAGRLEALGLRDRVTAGTFHAVAAAQLRRYWADRGTAPPALLERKTRLLGPLAAARPGLAGVGLGDLAAQLEWAKARLVTPETFAEAAVGRPLPAPAAEIAGLYQRYEDEKRRRGLIDFDDLLARTAEALATDPTFAGAQRWWWRHFFVDEFQDLNPLQHRLLQAWLGGRGDLCAVGDPNQAIYGWNGADPGLLDRFTEDWPGATVVHLDDNHRSTPQVVAAAAAVLGAAGARLRSTRGDGPAPEVRAYPSEDAEAAGVAAGLRQARAAGRAWSQMAVLVRTNAQSVALAGALRAAGIPHRVPGTSALATEPAVRAAMADLGRRRHLPLAMLVADLERAVDEGDGGRASGATGRTVGGSGAAGGLAEGGGASSAEGGGASSAEGGGASSGPDPEQAVALATFARLAREYLRLDPAGTVEGLRAWLPTVAGERDEQGDAVVICSFHRAKGLEWPAVWVCGLERGLVPLGRALTPAAEAEERRLLYVALTRAERELHCSWAQTRSFGAKPVPREASPWLALLQPAPVTAPYAGEVLDNEAWRARLAEQRRRLGDDPAPTRYSHRRRADRSRGSTATLATPDPAVVDALLRWRARRARAAGVPAHVLLHEGTLRALAALAPTSPDGLLDVPGLGPVKAARFGDELLAVLGEGPAAAAS